MTKIKISDKEKETRITYLENTVRKIKDLAQEGQFCGGAISRGYCMVIVGLSEQALGVKR